MQERAAGGWCCCSRLKAAGVFADRALL